MHVYVYVFKCMYLYVCLYMYELYVLVCICIYMWGRGSRGGGGDGAGRLRARRAAEEVAAELRDGIWDMVVYELEPSTVWSLRWSTAGYPTKMDKKVLAGDALFLGLEFNYMVVMWFTIPDVSHGRPGRSLAGPGPLVAGPRGPAVTVPAPPGHSHRLCLSSH
jgi:hypothetical protein